MNSQRLEEPASKSIQCLDRALDILEAVGRKEEMGVSEIARELSLHVATVHNLLRTLTARNYLLNHDGRYRLGPALGALLSDWSERLSLSRLLEPLVHELVEHTGESCVATVLAGFSAEMIVRLIGSNDVTAQFPRRIWPLPLRLSTGRLLVASAPEALWEEYIQRQLGSQDPPCFNADQWRRELETIRKKRACVQLNLDSSTSSVGVPVVGPGDVVVASIGISVPSFRASESLMNSLLKAARATAEQASALLGGELH